MSQKAGALPSDTPGSQGAGAGSQAHPSPIGDAQQVMEGGTPQAAPAGNNGAPVPSDTLIRSKRHSKESEYSTLIGATTHKRRPGLKP